MAQVKESQKQGYSIMDQRRGQWVMRPAKEFSHQDKELMLRLQSQKKGLRRIAMEVSIQRGAYAANIRQEERRRRTVSYEHVRQFLKCQETKVSKNQSAYREAVTRQETHKELDARWSQPQTDSKGGKN